MTAIIGNDGSIVLNTGHAIITRLWRGSFERTIVEVTGFADVNLRRNRGGNFAISGSAVGTPDTAMAIGAMAGVAGGTSMTLQIAAARTFILTALVSNTQVESDKNGQAVVTYDFVNGDSDAFTEGW